LLLNGVIDASHGFVVGVRAMRRWPILLARSKLIFTFPESKSHHFYSPPVKITPNIS
jgi:hypothetical protein